MIGVTASFVPLVPLVDFTVISDEEKQESLLKVTSE